MINILFLGDYFLTKDVMLEALERFLGNAHINFNFDSIVCKWPYKQFENNGDIKEFIDIGNELSNKIKDKDVIITHIAGLKKYHIEKAESLKIIGCTRSRPVNIDLKATFEKRIPIVYAPGRSTSSVVEFTIGLIINLRRKIIESHNALKNGIWDCKYFTYKLSPLPLYKQIIGLIGFGNIGRQIIRVFKTFGCTVLVFDPYVKEEIITKERGRKVFKIGDLIKQSDIISIHARPKENGKRLIGNDELNKMKKNAILINTARGSLIDYNALYVALKNHRIAGAALDTFETEPLDPLNKLLELDNVIVTPHIAGSTRDTSNIAAELVAKGIRDLIIGKIPFNIFKGDAYSLSINK